MNPFLFALSIVLGFAVSWFLVVKSTSREVPVLVRAASGPQGYADDHAAEYAAGYQDATADDGGAGATYADPEEHLEQEDTVATDVDDLPTGPIGGATAARPLPPSTDAPVAGDDPAGYAVKGDRQARLYLLDGDPDFQRARADIWFLDEQAAIDAGFTHYVRRA